MRRGKWPTLTALFLFLLVAGVACQFQAALDTAPLSKRPALTDLESIEQLQNAFNEGSGRPRLLMILAPL